MTLGLVDGRNGMSTTEAIDTIQDSPITAVLACLPHGSAERDEFLAGLDKHVRQVEIEPGATSSAALSVYVREWTISLIANKQGSWRTQIEASEDAVENGELGEPLSAEGLRAALRR